MESYSVYSLCSLFLSHSLSSFFSIMFMRLIHILIYSYSSFSLLYNIPISIYFTLFICSSIAGASIWVLTTTDIFQILLSSIWPYWKSILKLSFLGSQDTIFSSFFHCLCGAPFFSVSFGRSSFSTQSLNIGSPYGSMYSFLSHHIYNLNCHWCDSD